MGFTRSTTTTNVHSTLGDYPSVDDGLTPEQLKARFDSPATGLKTDLNGLMTELEASTSAASVGASTLYSGDTSDANVQAKLEHLQDELEGIALNEIPDNSITEAKLVSTYSSLLAKKNGILQTDLNSHKLGGKALSTIESERTAALAALKTEINNRTSPADTNYTVTLTSTTSTTTKTFDVKSRFMAFYIHFSNGSSADADYHFVLYDCRNSNALLSLDDEGHIDFNASTITLSSASAYPAKIQNILCSNNVISMDVVGKVSGSNKDVTIKCMALDGLLP